MLGGLLVSIDSYAIAKAINSTCTIQITSIARIDSGE